ncbi:MAG: winged helix DNA-binding domain-containing protein [Candidatus Bathyarchaeia archaeon]
MSLSKAVSLQNARNFVLRKQRLLPSLQGKCVDDVFDVVKNLAGVQYDPLPVVAQAHYVTLWNRVQGFRAEWLDSLLYEKRSLIEFMLMRQALHIVPIDELPYYYQGVRNVFRLGWVQKAIDGLSRETKDAIVRKIKSEGVVTPKDFDFFILRRLFFSGEIFIVKREEGVFRMPYYCLFKDYFPNVDLNSVDEETARKWLALKTLSSFGISSTSHVAYWIGFKVKETNEILAQLEKEGKICKISVEGLRGTQWVRTEDLDELERESFEEDFVALLTPMDNLVRDRRWLQQLFGYTFEIEYFQKKGMKWQVNILHKNEFLGFINPKANRPKKSLLIKDFILRRKLDAEELEKILARIEEFAKFHDATTIEILNLEPKETAEALIKHGFKRERNTLMREL